MGDAIGQLLSGGGVELPGVTNEETGEPLRVSFREILLVPKLQTALVAKLLAVFEKLDADDVLQLADELLVGQLAINLDPSGRERVFQVLESGDEIDDYVPDPFTLAGLAQRAFQISCLPFLPAGDTKSDSQAGRTSPKPADT